tara:strand:+ start:318 stop:779 length:462 start_codon:yes stop_codon:yes gene_type:complete
MAYNHSRYEVTVEPATPSSAPAAGFNGIDFNQPGATVAAGVWAPGIVPHRVRAAAVIPLVTAALADDVSVNFDADLTTPGTPTNLFKILWPTEIKAHKSLYYVPTYNIEILPGQHIDVRVTTLGAAGSNAKVVLYVEPRWEEPGNITAMQLAS